jgi:RNA-directed DNA polymerase
LEEILRRRFKGCKVNYTRYADDFVITGKSKEILENEVKPIVEQFLLQRGLLLSEEKTLVTHIDEGFDFLGFNIKCYNGKLLIKPTKKSIQSIKDKIKTVINENKQTNQYNLIRFLNPIVRGWGNYYSHVVSKRIFSNIDYFIFTQLKRWAKRRHRNKSTNWSMKKYFGSSGDRNWVFKSGKTELIKMGKIPIKRHIKIRMAANPYDSDFKEYFAKRSYYHLYKDKMNVYNGSKYE